MQEFLHVIRSAQVSAPSLELMLLLAVLALALVFRATRLGLFVAYIFVYRWGWLFFNETFGKDQRMYLQWYTVLGAVVAVLGIISLLTQDRDR